MNTNEEKSYITNETNGQDNITTDDAFKIGKNSEDSSAPATTVIENSHTTGNKKIKSPKKIIKFVPLFIFLTVCAAFFAGFIIFLFGPIYVESDGECTLVEYRSECYGIVFYKHLNLEIEEYHDGLLVTHISSGAFENCSRLKTIEIPVSIKTIGDSAFVGCSSLKSINVDPDNRYYKSVDGNLYSKDGTVLICYAQGKKERSFTIPDGVTTIASGAFYGCESLEKVVIPDGVTNIEKNAFRACSSLKSIDIPSSITHIEDYAFAECQSLVNINFIYGITKIGNLMFYKCSSLKEVKIPESVETIGDYAFAECSSLQNVYIPKSVNNFGNATFSNCTNLTSVHCNARFGSFNFMSGEPFPYVKTLILGGTTIPGGLNWINVEHIVLTGNITSISDEAFQGCHSLKTVTISSSVTKIGEYAFDCCFALTDIHYTGTEEQWANIEINNEGNSKLSTTKIHFNCDTQK